jgi:ABC-type multidrug transport system permease subunit
MKHRDNTALALGAVIAVVHFVVICALAALVIREQHSDMAAEYWEYASLFDVPVNLVLLLLSPLLPLLSVVAS